MEKPLILVIDDEPEMADNIAQIIRQTARYEAVTAYGAIEALEILDKNKRFAGLADNKIKGIVLDLKMPEMDGLQFIRRFRREEPFYKLMPIIVLTAYEDEEKWLVTTSPTVGKAAAYLKKPVNVVELVDTLDRIFHGEGERMIDETREKKYQKLDEFEKEKREKKPGEEGRKE